MDIRAFRWYGGKFRLVNIIRFLIPEHTAYYEPFMGSAAVLLNHKRSKLEVINDLDSDLVCFMRTLADREKGKELTERLCKLWYGKSFFDEALQCKKRKYRGMSDIDRAVMVYILITQSFNTIRESFANKAYKDTNAYRASIIQNIPHVYERLEGVRVLNMNGIDLIAKVANNENAFVFADPPYRHDLRGKGADDSYECELLHSEQIRMLKTIRSAKCKIMLCGYKTEKGVDLYDKYLLTNDKWKCYKLADIVKACQVTKVKKDMAQEFIWVNYELPASAKYVISLKEYNSLEEDTAE